MVLYERLDVFIKHVGREVFQKRPPCQYRLQDFGKHDGYDAGSGWWVEAFDLLDQRMGQSCSVDLCPIFEMRTIKSLLQARPNSHPDQKTRQHYLGQYPPP